MPTTATRCMTRACAAMVFCGILAACTRREGEPPALTIVPGTQAPHQIGRYCASDKTMVAAPGEKGYLSFGPYAKLKTGLYEVTFDIAVQGGLAKAGKVDINAYDPNYPIGIVGSADLSHDGPQRVALRFNAIEGPRYEFRVDSDGGSTVRLAGIVVKRIN